MEKIKRGIKFRILASSLCGTILFGGIGYTLKSLLEEKFNPTSYASTFSIEEEKTVKTTESKPVVEEKLETKEDENVLVAVPSSVRNYLGTYYSIYKNLTYINGNYINPIDKYITSDRLGELKSLTINGLEDSNLDYLKYFTGLETLTIENAHMLTDDNIDFINSLNLHEVRISLDYSTVDYLVNSDINLNRINNCKFSLLLVREEELLLFDKYDNMLKEYLTTERYEELKELNEYANDIVKSLNILPTDDEVDKLIKVYHYVTENIDYDQYVKSHDDDDKKGKELTADYNIRSLSSFKEQKDLNGDSYVVSGVCHNYAFLFDLLCHKCGVKTMFLSGHITYDLTSVDNRHAWNSVTFTEDITIPHNAGDTIIKKGDTRYFELTWNDNDEIFYELYEGYMSSKDEKEKNAYKSICLSRIEEFPLNAVFTDKHIIDSSYKGKDKRYEPYMFNQSVDGKSVSYYEDYLFEEELKREKEEAEKKKMRNMVLQNAMHPKTTHVKSPDFMEEVGPSGTFGIFSACGAVMGCEFAYYQLQKKNKKKKVLKR